MSPLRNRLCLALLTVAAVAAASAPAALAGPLVASAPSCDSPVVSQPFMPWLDFAHYTQAAGGDFETGAAGWSLSGGAAVAAGNESFHVSGASDSNSLALPSGSAATSPTTCVGVGNPTVRFFAKHRAGQLLALLAVSVQFEDAFGNVHSLPIGVVAGSSSWQPTLPMLIVANLLPLLPNDMTPVTFSFTAISGDWSIDDVNIDPYFRH